MTRRGPSAAKSVVAALVATTWGSAVVSLVAAELVAAAIDEQIPVESELPDAFAGPPVEDAADDVLLDAFAVDAEPGPRIPDGAPLPPRDLIADNGGGCGCDPTGRPEHAGRATSLWIGGVAWFAGLGRRRHKNRAGRP